MQNLEIDEKKDHILILAPHPDDECIGAGGVLSRFPSLCDVIVLTDGREGQGNMPPVKTAVVRKHEFLAEMKSLGKEESTFQMLGLPDGSVFDNLYCLAGIDLSSYTKIFVTDEYDDNGDHIATFQCLITALREQKNESVEVYSYEVHTPIQRPTHFLDITDEIDEKMHLIRFHQSQLRDLPYDVLAGQEALYRATLFRMPGKKIEVYRKLDLRSGFSLTEKEENGATQKDRIIYWICKSWMSLLLRGKSLASVLKEKGFHTVTIYGYGDLGQFAVRDLLHGNVGVPYAMDRRAEAFQKEKVPVLKPSDSLETADVDAVVVTTVTGFFEIKELLSSFGFQNILPLRNLLEEGNE